MKLWGECILIFGILPLVVAVMKPSGWMYLMLWVVAWFAWRSLVKKGYRFSEEWNGAKMDKSFVVSMLIRFIPLAMLLALFTYFMIPDHLFSLLRKPLMWMMVMTLYPILSVIPQEIVFRSFFFRRYAALFRSDRAMILASALAFGWVHILLLNWVAIVFSTCGGIIFASTYNKTRSLAAVCLEHALYGCMVFTLGLGVYFFHSQAVHG